MYGAAAITAVIPYAGSGDSVPVGTRLPAGA